MLTLVNKKKEQAKQATLLNLQKSMQLSLMLQDKALNSKSSGVDSSHTNDITVSLTTFSYRVHDVYLTIESMFQQSVKPTRVVLWLSTRDFPNKQDDVPAILKKQQERGLDIEFCEEDLGPYTKYFYTLQKYPNSLVVTIDDDILYAPDTLDLLYSAYKKEPHIIHCLRAHKMLTDDSGKLIPYKQWPKSTQQREAGLDIFPTGVGSVLYFPGCFDADVLNKALFLKLAPNSDDVWLKAMSLKQGTLCKKVYDERPWPARNPAIAESQKYALKRKNKQAGIGNDSKIKAVFDHYNLWQTL